MTRNTSSLWYRLALIALVVSAGVATPAAFADTEGGSSFGFVGNQGDDSASVVDLAAGMALAPTINLLPDVDYPYDATMTPDGSEVWLCGAVSDGVVVVSTATQTIAERISLAGMVEYPVDVIFHPDGSTAYVASRDSAAIAVIDTSTYTVTTTIPVPAGLGFGAGKMAISPDGSTLWTVKWFGDRLITVDLSTNMATFVPLGNDLWDLRVSPDGATLYLIDRGTDQVHVYDLGSAMITSSISVGDDPWGIDITPDGSTLVVANEDDGTVSVIDLATGMVTTVTLDAGADPRDVEITGDGERAYVPSGDLPGSDLLYEIDIETATILDSIDLGTVNPNVVAIRPDGPATIFADGFESGDTTAWSAVVP